MIGLPSQIPLSVFGTAGKQAEEKTDAGKFVLRISVSLKTVEQQVNCNVFETDRSGTAGKSEFSQTSECVAEQNFKAGDSGADLEEVFTLAANEEHFDRLFISQPASNGPPGLLCIGGAPVARQESTRWVAREMVMREPGKTFLDGKAFQFG
ncbi:hypothetical protein VPH49_24685 [Pseudomonas luteola]|uniref:hypothetical protein n=1 Tax=Pseudomonas luteola TaxID=47886 RepID=UPI0012383F44|nr:hypothetical protein [Pseudomonas luteola]QEU26319.1 hypothetical protein FOB45_00420 [Pseudomonas luteola]